ncbi:MAG: hypothetical protein V4519_04435 [Patescibacteria group bacterium]
MHELLTQFGVDWKLLLAQIVNFTILLILLKKFAYAPLIGMLKKRQRIIKEGIEASEESQRKLVEAKNIEKQIILKAEQTSLDIVSEAENIASTQAKQIVESAHLKSDHVIAQGQKKLEEEHRKLNEEVERSAQLLVANGLARVIGKLDQPERDKALIQEALRELKAISSSS